MIQNDNFVAEITLYLRKFAKLSTEIKDLVESKQDKRKEFADKRRRNAPRYTPGDKVWVTTHPISSKSKDRSAKFAPRRDGPYVIITQCSPTSYEVANVNSPEVPLGTYHTSALRPYIENPRARTEPILPLRKRGRPKKTVSTVNSVPSTSSGYWPRRLRNQGGRL